MSERKFIKTFSMISILLAFCVLTAQAQLKTRLSPLGNLVAGIQERADNLNYISEQDWDVNVFVIGRNVSALNTQTFLAANPFIAFVPIEEIPVNDFFTRLENRDAAWTNLRNYLEANLTSLKVFKAKSIRREVYAVGLFQGHIVGIRTFAVKT
jgi:hypothetical protein